MKKQIEIDGNSLSLQQLEEVALNKTEVSISQPAQQSINKCRDYVEKLVNDQKVVYGLTTGFGKFATVTIPNDKIEELQENLILSHATGLGKSYSIAETRAVTLLRCNVLAKGNSGIRLSTLQTLVDMLNAGIHPCIPEQGSVGASGDLAPLSHLALVLLGEGYAEYKGEIMTGKEAMDRAGIKPVRLAAKEGLALNNGTQVMTAVAALTLNKALKLCKVADICAAISVDALLGTPKAYHPLVHSVRPHQGQINAAKNLTNLLSNSPLRESHLNCDSVQDPYSLRCTPQVHGAVRDSLAHVKRVLEVEINSATDNPLIFPDADEVISGGNFHGEPIAFVADMLSYTTAELGSISERRIEQICNPALNRGLNAFLAPRPGLDSGYMIAQVTAASLVSENKTKSFPASVDSVPTSANQEDHVSMGTIGANKSRDIIENVNSILAIELLMALQALESREHPSSPVIEAIRKEFRKEVPVLDKDRNINPDMLKAKEFIASDRILEIAKEFLDLE
ncbi:MAG: histidine ammonia-lyase [Candidatus Cloacimonadia bacterium]